MLKSKNDLGQYKMEAKRKGKEEEKEKKEVKEKQLKQQLFVLYLSKVLASHRDSREASTPLKSLLPPGSCIMLRLSILLALGDTGSTDGFISTVPVMV